MHGIREHVFLPEARPERASRQHVHTQSPERWKHDKWKDSFALCEHQRNKSIETKPQRCLETLDNAGQVFATETSEETDNMFHEKGTAYDMDETTGSPSEYWKWHTKMRKELKNRTHDKRIEKGRRLYQKAKSVSLDFGKKARLDHI